MVKATGQVFPFDGDSGVYGQAGSEERNRGKWRIHAVNNLFDEFTCGHWDATTLKDRLEEIDEEMYKGWHELDLAAALTALGGGSSLDPRVWEFINHVRLLADDDTHLYSAFRP